MFLRRPEHHPSSPEGPDGTAEKKKVSLMPFIRAVLGWMIFYEQLVYSREKGDLKAWERFRDELMGRWWKNLIVAVGPLKESSFMDPDALLTSLRRSYTVFAIVKTNFLLTGVPLTLGIISLFSSLASVGFGIGMRCVLGDVQGATLRRYPNLYLFALSIPEIWTFISFGSFFIGVGTIVWQYVAAKGWAAKAGVIVSVTALLVHLTALTFLSRETNTAKFLLDEMNISGSGGEVSQVLHLGRLGLPETPDMRSSQIMIGSVTLTQASFSHSKAPLRTKKAPESM
ncbi:hypothetical protein M0805_007528 [Coniferiporia weirii]|nr:hypothetical protein M0805_007528 [Coniferiporia weirii]